MFNYFFYIKEKFFSNSKNYQAINSSNIKNIILSHLVSYQNISFTNDFYFGKLPYEIGKNNTLVILVDHIKFNKKNIQYKIKDNFIILSRSLNFLDEILLHLHVLFLYFFENNNLNKLTDYLKLVDTNRISMQVLRIILKYKPKNFLFTFEGNDYENIIIKKIKNKKINIESIGYQFSALKKKHIKVISSLKKIMLPNKIFTINSYNKKILQNKLKKIKIINIGFLKKNIISKSYKNYNNKKIKNILVMPEGIPSEIELFLKYCNKNLNSNLRFNLRLHPIYRNENLLKKYNIVLGNDIRLSKNSLLNDFKKNNFILYRGTASIIDAVNQNLIPIYLNRSKELTVDPIYNVNKFHKINYNQKLINFFPSLNNKKFVSDRKKIHSFTKNYYHRYNIQLIKKNLR